MRAPGLAVKKVHQHDLWAGAAAAATVVKAAMGVLGEPTHPALKELVAAVLAAAMELMGAKAAGEETGEEKATHHLGAKAA